MENERIQGKGLSLELKYAFVLDSYFDEWMNKKVKDDDTSIQIGRSNEGTIVIITFSENKCIDYRADRTGRITRFDYNGAHPHIKKIKGKINYSPPMASPSPFISPVVVSPVKITIEKNPQEEQLKLLLQNRKELLDLLSTLTRLVKTDLEITQSLLGNKSSVTWLSSIIQQLLSQTGRKIWIHPVSAGWEKTDSVDGIVSGYKDDVILVTPDKKGKPLTRTPRIVIYLEETLNNNDINVITRFCPTTNVLVVSSSQPNPQEYSDEWEIIEV